MVGENKMSYSTTYLKHYGIQGMHWGEKNGPPYPLSENKVARMKKQSVRREVKELSDEELNKRISRLQKEQQYIKLNSSDVTKGNEFIKAALIGAGTLFVTNLVSSASREAGKAIINAVLHKS